MNSLPEIPIIPLALMGLGGLLAILFGIVLLVKAFKTGVGWGFLVILLPILGLLIFIGANWSAAGKSFLAWLAGPILFIVGCVLGMQKVDPEQVEAFKQQVEEAAAAAAAEAAATEESETAPTPE